LNNPVVYRRAAGGLTLSQLITDFGRTHNLVGSAELRAKAEASAADATAADVILAVDEVYYRELGAQSVLNVANETVKARRTTVDQISALTNAKLRSTLDLSFANVALAQAKLLLLDATIQSQDAVATLNALLGEQGAPHYLFVNEGTAAAPPPDDPEALVGVAFAHRPDLQSAAEQAKLPKSSARRSTISTGLRSPRWAQPAALAFAQTRLPPPGMALRA
jgi:outer membrane protein